MQPGVVILLMKVRAHKGGRYYQDRLCGAVAHKLFLLITTKRADEASTPTSGGDAFWYGARPKVTDLAHRG
jgi:hypothetical protein